MKKIISVVVLSMLIVFALSACYAETRWPTTTTTPPNFTILSSSENQDLEPLVKEYADKNNLNIKMVYKGSIDGMQDLQTNPTQYNALWLSNSIWMRMGDTKGVVKNDKSIMRSPVVLGIKDSVATKLGFKNKDVYVKDVLDAVNQKKLTFAMTSASQSNSGMSAYLGFLYAFAGNPDVLSLENLNDQNLKNQIKQLLLGQNRSSGSSGYLGDLFLQKDFDAMFNYESVIISTNQKLIQQGKEPLYAVYLKDGLTVADYPFAYIDNKDPAKETIFKGLQDYLTSKESKKKIANLGRRTGIGGIVDNADPNVFNIKWGIDVGKVLAPLKYPKEDVILAALNLYQTDLKKPSFTVFALDYSGSMSGDGETQLKEAIELLLNQEKAKPHLLQAGQDDKIVVIPFNSGVIDVWKGSTKEGYDQVISNVQNLTADGGTDIYGPTVEALKILKDVSAQEYIRSIVLMTDGRSDGDADAMVNYFNKLEMDIPVFSITFGDADPSQLKNIADITKSKVFDSKGGLVDAFKKVRGYN